MTTYFNKIVDFGESIYFSFVEMWNWLFTPIVLYSNEDALVTAMEQGRPVDNLQDTINGFNKLFGMLSGHEIEEISFLPVQFLLVGLSTIILVKLIAIITDALPWL